MKSAFTKFLMCVALVAICNFSNAATYYFSTLEGNDSRTSAQAQNPSTPWKTLGKLNAIFSSLNPGDKILFKRGEKFYGTIHINKSGSLGNPITFDAYGNGNKPIITSLISLNNWVNVGNGIYESHQPSFASNLNVVLLNNQIQEMGRYPNNGSSNKGYLNIESTNKSNTISNATLSSTPNWTGGEVVVRKSFFTIDRHPINSHSGNTLTYNYVSGTYSPNKDFGFFIQGHIKTLDKLGEWYYNPSSKKLSIYFGSNQPASQDVQASTIEYLVTNVQNTSHILFQNLHFKGANRYAFNLNHAQHVAIKNVDVDFSGEDAAYIHNLPNLTIENCTINYSQNNGLSIMQNTADAKIINNKIENTNLLQGMGKSGVGNGYAIHATSNNNLIEYNEIKNTAYIGIRFGGNYTTVKNNLIDNFCITKDDGAGIYTWTGSSNQEFVGRKIIGNIIINGIGAHEGTPSSKPQAEGIYLDDNTSGVEVVGNTVENVSSKGIYVHNARNIVVKENRFVNNGTQLHMGHDNLGNPIRNAQILDNIFFASKSAQLASYVGSVKDDINQMGNLDRNFYARPADDVLTIMTQHYNLAGRQSNNYNLEGWKKTSGKDLASKRSPLIIPTFKIVNLDSYNKYAYGTYSTSSTVTSGIHGSNSNLSWNSGGKLDQGALQVRSNGNSSVTLKTGSLKRDKHYVLKFSAMASKNAILKVLLMQSNSPYATLGEKVTVEIKTNRNEYEVILPIANDEYASSLRFEATDSDLTYWLDNVALHEAEAESIDPADYIRFEYNPTKTNKTIALDGTYVDMKNTTHSGSLTLAPFSSRVLLRTSIISAPVVQPTAPTVSIVSPTNLTSFLNSSDIEIKADARDENGSITKLEFFQGAQLIGTVNSAPFTYTWNNVPTGAYVITVKATNNQSLSTTSAPVTLKVESPTIIEEILDPITNDNPSFTLYLNSGSKDSQIYGGISYLGDLNFASYYNSNSTFSNGNASPDKLFQTERNGQKLGYSIPVPNGTYTVKTFHNELWFGKLGPASAIGRRVFDISLEGNRVKTNFDIFVANGNRETILIFENIEVKDGQLNLDMVSSRDRATISGIAILGANSTPVTEEPKELLPSVSHEVYFNTGTANKIQMDGKEFNGDRNFQNFSSGSNENSNTAASSLPLYQTERNAQTLNYTILVPNGTYTVKTYHNELWFGKSGPVASTGRRVFNISLEGKLVKGNFDIFVENANKPTVLTFENIEVKDGKLNLDMIASRDRASISGIAILGSSLSGANLRMETNEVKSSFLEKSNTIKDETKIYPNPARDNATVSIDSDILLNHILIHNMSGQLMNQLNPMVLKAEPGKYQIPLTGLPQGIYLVSLVGEQEMISQHKLMVRQ